MTPVSRRQWMRERKGEKMGEGRKGEKMGEGEKRRADNSHTASEDSVWF